MTPREKDTLDAIRDLTVDGVSPTYVQLMQRLGIASKSGVNRMVTSLERQGRVRRRFGCRNALEIVRPVEDIAERVCQRALIRGFVTTSSERQQLRSIVLEALA